MNDRLFQIAALKAMSSSLMQKYDELRAEALAELNPGDQRMILSPLDGKTPIGRVSRSSPKDIPIIVDEEALTAWMVENYRDQTESVYDIVGTLEQVKAVLFEHAPRLLKRRSRVRQDARKQLLSDAAVMKHPVGPGGEADMPGIKFLPNSQDFVACRPDKDALLALFELRRAGRIDLDGALLPALEAGNDA